MKKMYQVHLYQVLSQDQFHLQRTSITAIVSRNFMKTTARDVVNHTPIEITTIPAFGAGIVDNEYPLTKAGYFVLKRDLGHKNRITREEFVTYKQQYEQSSFHQLVKRIEAKERK